MRRTRFLSLLVIGLCVSGTLASAADRWGLTEGKPDLKSAGPLTFGPDGILFVGDTQSAAIFAIATGDTSGSPGAASVHAEDLAAHVAKATGAPSGSVAINDMAVSPRSGSAYLSVSTGSAKSPALVRIAAGGEVTQVSLDKVAFARATLSNPPADAVVGEGRGARNNRGQSITDLAYVDGKLIFSGLSTGESPSRVREIAFPFADTDAGASVEIYHGAHGKSEDYAAIRTFVPFNINGEPNLLAAYVCTPLVKFPLSSLEAGGKVRGTTVAELGNRNQPLDMIVYQQDGRDFLLLTNSARGVMKISTEDIARKEGINERVAGTAGQKYETITELQGVVQLDKLDDKRAVIITQGEGGAFDLRTIPLP